MLGAMKIASSLLLLGLVACGGDDGGGSVDAPVAPSMLTLSGNASSIGISGSTPEADVAITLYKASDDSVLGTTTTDASGNFSITQTTDGTAVDGYLKATKASFKDTYLYPPGPLSADFAGATVLLLTPGTWDSVNSTLLGETQEAGHGWVGMLVMDSLATQTAIEGATVTTSPAGKIHYNGSGSNPLPNRNATATAADGIAYAVDVAAGDVTVNAAKSGLTFKSHKIKARADQITLTIITE